MSTNYSCELKPPKGIKAHLVKHRVNPRWRLQTGELLTRYLFRKYHGIVEYKEGEQINHTCNNSLCVNINHLYLGTQKENMADRKEAGRTNLGKKFGKRDPATIRYDKLTPEIHAEIKRIYSLGEMSQSKLAKQYGVSQVAIFKIVKEISKNRQDKTRYRILSKKIYENIRSSYASGKYSYEDLAKMFSVGKTMVYKILKLHPKILKPKSIKQCEDDYLV